MIIIKDLKKSFRANKILKGINLSITDNETHAIIGKSGCGKSVLLKHIVGLLFPDSGHVSVDNQRVDKLNEEQLFDIRKKFGFLFQGAALFDSMSVEENIALPLVENPTSVPTEKIANRVEEMLSLVNLPGIQKLKPSELSGGMKKRVGLARALITEPKYILYDEPTTGLDPVMSDSIDLLIKNLSESLNVTSIVVTHDLFSVENVADRISMINDGEILFTGTLDELLNSNLTIIQNFIKRSGFFGKS